MALVRVWPWNQGGPGGLGEDPPPEPDPLTADDLRLALLPLWNMQQQRDIVVRPIIQQAPPPPPESKWPLILGVVAVGLGIMAFRR
jgi:hypothetical protein